MTFCFSFQLSLLFHFILCFFSLSLVWRQYVHSANKNMFKCMRNKSERKDGLSWKQQNKCFFLYYYYYFMQSFWFYIIWSSSAGFIAAQPSTCREKRLSNWDAWIVLKAKANRDWVTACRWFLPERDRKSSSEICSRSVLTTALERERAPFLCAVTSSVTGGECRAMLGWASHTPQQDKLTFHSRYALIRWVGFKLLFLLFLFTTLLFNSV